MSDDDGVKGDAKRVDGALVRRRLVCGNGRAAFGVPLPVHGLGLLELRRVTDTVESADVTGGLHQVAQGAKHLLRGTRVVL